MDTKQHIYCLMRGMGCIIIAQADCILFLTNLQTTRCCASLKSISSGLSNVDFSVQDPTVNHSLDLGHERSFMTRQETIILGCLARYRGAPGYLSTLPVLATPSDKALPHSYLTNPKMTLICKRFLIGINLSRFLYFYYFLLDHESCYNELLNLSQCYSIWDRMRIHTKELQSYNRR